MPQLDVVQVVDRSTTAAVCLATNYAEGGAYAPDFPIYLA